MAIAKYEKIKLGVGNYQDNTHSTIHSSNVLPSVSDGKDGDVWIKAPNNWTNGQDVEIFLKINGSWRGISGSPIEITLNDNVSIPTEFLAISSSLFTKLEVHYSLQRAGNDEHVRSGIYTILLNNLGFQYNHEFSEIGTDLGVDITLVFDSGNIKFKYTTTNVMYNRLFKYTIRGWK